MVTDAAEMLTGTVADWPPPPSTVTVHAGDELDVVGAADAVTVIVVVVGPMGALVGEMVAAAPS